LLVQHRSQYIDRRRPNGFLTNNHEEEVFGCIASSFSEDDVYGDANGLVVPINVDPTFLGYDMTNQPKTGGTSKPR
jgi:hypothetical protein